MLRYEISMRIEGDGGAEIDPELTKTVDATDESGALRNAREKIRKENQEHNYQKIWCWNIRRLLH
jgi:hypothetical protein